MGLGGVDVTNYINKVAFSAILDPADEVTYSDFHYSPMLTRPKDNNKRS